MPELDLRTLEAQPPPLTEDGEPIPCPRCGRIFERPLEGIATRRPRASALPTGGALMPKEYGTGSVGSGGVS